MICTGSQKRAVRVALLTGGTSSLEKHERTFQKRRGNLVRV
jgi:hypothetical protein